MSLVRVAALGALLVAAAAQAAPPPKLLGYQGTMDRDGVPFTGYASMRFRLFDGEEGGDLLWDELQASVPVSHGRFAARLGATVALAPVLSALPELWLEVSVKPAGSPEEYVTMTPRQRVDQAVASLVSDPTEVIFGALAAAQGGAVAGSVDVSGALPVKGPMQIGAWADFAVSGEYATTSAVTMPAFQPGHGFCFLLSVDTNLSVQDADKVDRASGCVITSPTGEAGPPVLEAHSWNGLTCRARCFTW